MHIFFITQWFPTVKQPYYGIFILEQARAVAQVNHVSLMHILGVDPTVDQPIQITTRSDNPGIDVYTLSYQRPTIPFTTWIRQVKGARKVFGMASKNHGSPDIIHANVSNTADISVILGRLAAIPVVLSEHSTAYARKLYTPSQIRRIRFFMNRVDLIMPVCNALGQYIRGYGITRPMLTVPNVVDSDIFSPALSGEQVSTPFREITLIARLNKEKAVHLAIQATAKLQQQGIYYHLQIAGDGPEEAYLRSLVDTLGLSKWIHFHGYLPKIELAKILKRSSLFLLTSLWENQPVVILEALTCGLPVLAPAISGIPEVVTTECGLLFKPGDVEDLVSKLRYLITNLTNYDAQVIHQYATDHFSPVVVGNQLDSIYRQIIEGHHGYNHVPGN